MMTEAFHTIYVFSTPEAAGEGFVGLLHSTEFWAALLGVAAGFIFSLLGDALRFKAKQLLAKRQIEKEVRMLRDDALEALSVHIENDKLDMGSNVSPRLAPPLDLDVILDKNLLLEARVDMRRRQAIKNIRSISSVIDKVRKAFEVFFTDAFRKHRWDFENKNLCHYYAFLIYHCDSYLEGRGSVVSSRNVSEAKTRNDEVLDKVEHRYGVEISRT